MAEDKRVRISADMTPLRQLREEALSVYREIEQASSASEQETEKGIQQLREQLSLMEDRNELERLLIDLKRQSNSIQLPSQPSNQGTYDPESGSISWDLSEEKRPKGKKKKKYSETETTEEEEDVEEKPKKKRGASSAQSLREINEHVENIDNTVTNIDNSRRTENNQENVIDTVRNQESITENIKNIERNVENITENTSVLKDRDPVEPKEEPSLPTERSVERQSERNIPERREQRVEVVTEKTGFSDENIIKAINEISSLLNESKKEFNDNLQEIIKGRDKDKEPNSVLRYLETLSQSLSMIEDNVDKIETEIVEIGKKGRTPGVNQGGKSGESNLNIIGGLGKGGIAGILGGLGAMSLLNTAKNTISERYFRNQEAEFKSQYQGTVETAANYKRVDAANEADKYRWIPVIGDMIARGIEQPANLMADRMMQTVQKYFDAEGKSTLYTQTFGDNANNFLKTGSKEGNYAANALGMDIGAYLQRSAELTRASGGVTLGGNEYDVRGVREIQSTMAAERLYGLSSGSVNKLQGALRFGDETESYGSSAVIRSFERSMQELQLPFSEIASTMEESLETFTRQADKILSKSGEFDAGRLTAILAGVREMTGFKGRQLERVQEVFTGSGISQDQVTQALLLRTLQQTNPEVKTYSEAMEKLEKIQSGNAEPQFMKDFLLELQGLTQNNEQFINLVKGVFPNLSYEDIRKQFGMGDPREYINNLYDKIKSEFATIRRTPSEAYESTEASRTVGTGARITANDTNRQIYQGSEDLLEVVKMIKANTDRIPETEEMKETAKRMIANSSMGVTTGPMKTGTVATPGISVGVEVTKALAPLFERFFIKMGLVSDENRVRNSLPKERE